MRRRFTYRVSSLLVWLLLGSVSILTGCASLEPCAATAAPVESEHRVYVLRHGWHTGIVVPAGTQADPLHFLQAHFPRASYYEIGWGDQGFYTAEKIRAGLALRALFWPTGSVMHVVGLPGHPRESAHDELAELRISADALRRLNRAMADSFALNARGSEQVIEPGLYGDSLFFEAEGVFWFGNTCNTWTARRLDDAGVPMRTLGTITAGSVVRQARGAARRCDDGE